MASAEINIPLPIFVETTRRVVCAHPCGEFVKILR